MLTAGAIVHDALLPYEQWSGQMLTCYRNVILHIFDSMCCNFCLHSLICHLHQANFVELELGPHHKLKQTCMPTINTFFNLLQPTTYLICYLHQAISVQLELGPHYDVHPNYQRIFTLLQPATYLQKV